MNSVCINLIVVDCNNLREAREELSKAGKEGSGVKKQDAAAGILKRSKSELSIEKVSTETSSIKETDLDVKLVIDEVASGEEVEEVDNDDLDQALAEADLGFTLDG